LLNRIEAATRKATRKRILSTVDVLATFLLASVKQYLTFNLHFSTLGAGEQKGQWCLLTPITFSHHHSTHRLVSFSSSYPSPSTQQIHQHNVCFCCTTHQQLQQQQQQRLHHRDRFRAYQHSVCQVSSLVISVCLSQRVASSHV
jgi:hypothetical protein